MSDKGHKSASVALDVIDDETATASKKKITWDRGKKLASHKELTIDTNLSVYFCGPHGPRQRGTNGNKNGFSDSTSQRELAWQCIRRMSWAASQRN
jgi:IS30 family transposase